MLKFKFVYVLNLFIKSLLFCAYIYDIKVIINIITFTTTIIIIINVKIIVII